VTLTRPKMRHTKVQYRLVEQIGARTEGLVAAEVPFRARADYDLRGADVAFVSRSRWDATTAGLRVVAASCIYGVPRSKPACPVEPVP
jgi:hypothetical protein